MDDEELIRRIVGDGLGDPGDSVPNEKPDAPGLETLQSDARIDVLVSDVGSPRVMNVRRMANASRQMRPDLPVLFVTGFAEATVIGAGRLMPGIQIIPKPFDFETLAMRIRTSIDSRMAV